MPLNEKETRDELIDPAIKVVGWTEEHIRREETAGRIAIIKGKAVRSRSGRTDYTLRIKISKEAQPVAVAVLEAKSEDKHPSYGLEQSKLYARAKLLNTPFVFATNGHLFIEHDRFTGLTSDPKPLAEFPTPGELWTRYEKGMGFQLTDEAAKPLVTPYAGGGENYRRYYQDACIRAVFEKCAKPEEVKRALISLATGGGKTTIAALMLRRFADAGQLSKALFICDRTELRENGAKAMRAAFGSNAAEVKEGDPAKNARVLIATYQTLGIDKDDADASFLLSHYPENYFSHIIIDECHRSAWGKWSEVLRRNPDAVQIGLTATPRKIRIPEGANAEELADDERLLADNIRHFGEPVYEYDLAQAMEDGYLAACEIRKRDIFLEDMKEPEQMTGLKKEQLADKTLRDPVTGATLTLADLEKKYKATRFEGLLKLPDRVEKLAADLFDQLLAHGGPEQKTIIFCASDDHADNVTAAMNNLYAKWCKQTGKTRVEPYAFKCTGASDGNDLVPDFRGSRTHHFIAATVDLLSTGVDLPCVRNIVFARYLRSSILFYQMLGRGTRIDAATQKLMFRVWDYTNATRLFGKEFISPLETEYEEGEGGNPGPIRVEARGISVEIHDGGHSLLADVNGKAMPVSVADYKVRLASALLREAPDLPAFVRQWIDPQLRVELIAHLPESGTSAEKIRLLSEMNDYDLYDVLAQLAYQAPARTRLHRVEAFASANSDWLAGHGGKTEAVLLALVHQFVESGTEGLEMRELFDVPEVQRAGGFQALQTHGDPTQLVMETKRRLFVA
jgi:type I restriction enzyme R subunit